MARHRERQARDMILRMVANFPGLYDDLTFGGEVNGAELVEWVSNEIHAMKPDYELRARAEVGSPTEEENHALREL